MFLQRLRKARALTARLKKLLDALSGHDDAGRRIAVETLLMSDSSEVIEAIAALSENGAEALAPVREAFSEAGAQAVEPLIAALDCDNVFVQQFAEKAIDGINDPHAVTLMLAALRHGSVRVRKAAVRYLIRTGPPAVGRLLELLESENPDLRRISAETLGSIGDRRAVAPLINALNDKTADVREAAQWALEEIGKPALPLLRKALEHENAAVRSNALEVLISMGDRQALPHIITALEEGTRDIRWKAASALGKIGNGLSIPRLIAALKDPDADIRKVAASALAEIGQRAIHPLIDSLNDPSSYHRQAAAAALSDMGADAVMSIIQRLESADHQTRANLLAVLEKMGESAKGILVKKMTHKDPMIRRECVRILGTMGDESLIEPIMKRLKDADKNVRMQAAESLGTFGEAAVQPTVHFIEKNREEGIFEASMILNAVCSATSRPIEPLLAHKTVEVRRIAARALGAAKASRAVKPLIELLSDPDRMVRESSAWALGEIGNPAAVGPLLAALVDETQEGELQPMLWALVKLSGEKIDEPLIAALESPSAAVRQRAATALGHLGSLKAARPLIAKLTDEDAKVRKAAVQSLGMLGAPEAEEPIREAMMKLQREEWMVFRDALRKIRKG